MKKILALILVLVTLVACLATTVSAAEPQKITLDLANDITLNPNPTTDNQQQVNGLSSACASFVDGKIVMENHGQDSTEEWSRSVIWFNKQIPTATYKYMVIDIKYGNTTLLKYDGTANPEGTFNPHVQVGYVASDIAATPSKWVSISSSTGGIITTSATPDAFMSDTFTVNDVKDKTIQMLITLPSEEAEGYDQYLNMLYINPYGWAMAAKDNVKVEISAIAFYDVNPFLASEDDNSSENNQDEENNSQNNNGTNNSNGNTTTETKAPETSAPETTEEPATEASTSTSGCGSVIGGSALVIATVTGAAVIIKRKRED